MIEYTGHEMLFDHPPEWVLALAASPSDASLRLVYADWLAEHGYPQREARQREIAAGLLAGVNTTRVVSFS